MERIEILQIQTYTTEVYKLLKDVPTTGVLYRLFSKRCQGKLLYL